MRRLNFRRSDRLGSRVADRKIRLAAQAVEMLETRVFLSASVVTQIPTTTVTGGESAAAITLSTYLNDPALTGGTVVEMQTPLGNIPLQLTNSRTPLTVANFEKYITNGEYTPTIIQRSAPGFVLQGGGTKPDGSNNASVASLQSEAGLSNVAGTIAMALSTGPNSGTNQWFINLGDNSSVLDGTNDGGPFTVFGNVIDGGMTVANEIAQLPIIDGAAENQNWYIGADDGLPVINYTGSSTPTTVPQANLVTDNIVQLSSTQAAPTYTASSANPALVTASITNGVLHLTPASTAASGTTTVTATVRDLAGETASSTFTVDVKAAPTVSVTSASGVAGTNSQIEFPVTLSAAVASATTLNYSVTAGTAPSGDFQAVGSSITIPAGSTQADIPVNILGNSTSANETFTLTLSGLSSDALFAGGNSSLTATGTIQPSGTVPVSTTVSVNPASAEAGGESQVLFPIALSAASTSATTFSYSLSAGTAPSADFSATGSSVTIPAGSTQAAIAVNVLADSTGADETFTLTLTGLSSNAVFAGGSSTLAVTGTIQPSGASQPSGTSTDLAVSSPSVPFGGADTLTATITPVVADTSITGTVTFFVGTVAVGTAPVTGDTAVLPIDLNAAGTQSITATYNGDANNATSSSSTVAVDVAAPSVIAPAIANSTVPSTAIAGQPFKGSLTASLSNASLIAAQTGMVTLNVYATSDGLLAPGSTLIATITRKLSIKPGKAASLTATVKSLPVSLAAGTYTLIVQAVDPSGALSTPVAGSVLTVAAPAIALNESFVKLALPSSVVAGSKTRAAATLKITNNGNVISSGVTTIRLYASPDGTVASGTLITTLSRKLAIKAGRFITISIPLGAYPSVADGNYSIVAQVTDPLSGVSSIGSSSTINIAAARIDLAAGALTAPATASEGKFIAVSLSVSNLGNVIAAGALDIAFAASASSTGSNPFDLATLSTTIKLQPGATKILHLRVPVAQGSPTGAMFLVAVVDPANSFAESDLTNNTAISSSAVTFG